MRLTQAGQEKKQADFFMPGYAAKKKCLPFVFAARMNSACLYQQTGKRSAAFCAS
jgi:hypothetical protein